MPIEVHYRDEIIELIERSGAQVVEVLGAEEYEDAHLPGAIHLSLGRLGLEAREVLDAARPVIVYCWDSA